MHYSQVWKANELPRFKSRPRLRPRPATWEFSSPSCRSAQKWIFLVILRSADFFGIKELESDAFTFPFIKIYRRVIDREIDWFDSPPVDTVIPHNVIISTLPIHSIFSHRSLSVVCLLFESQSLVWTSSSGIFGRFASSWGFPAKEFGRKKWVISFNHDS